MRTQALAACIAPPPPPAGALDTDADAITDDDDAGGGGASAASGGGGGDSAQPNAAAGRGPLCVAQMVAHEAAPRDVYAQGQPRGRVDVKALLIQLNVCGMGLPAPDWDVSLPKRALVVAYVRFALPIALFAPGQGLARKEQGAERACPTPISPCLATTTTPNPQELEGAMWDGLPKSQATTVEGMFKACSFGLADVSKKAGGALLRVAVPIPCSGVTPQGAGYSSSSCPFNGERQPLA